MKYNAQLQVTDQMHITESSEFPSCYPLREGN